MSGSIDWDSLSILPPPPAMDQIDQIAEQRGTRRKTAEQHKDDLLATWRDRIIAIKGVCKGIDPLEAVEIVMRTIKERSDRQFQKDMHAWKDDLGYAQREAAARAEAYAEAKKEDIAVLISENDKNRAERAEDRQITLRAIETMESMGDNMKSLTQSVTDLVGTVKTTLPSFVPPAIKDESKKEEPKKDDPKKV